jgi:hypothetical protein
MENAALQQNPFMSQQDLQVLGAQQGLGQSQQGLGQFTWQVGQFTWQDIATYRFYQIARLRAEAAQQGLTALQQRDEEKRAEREVIRNNTQIVFSGDSLEIERME